MSFIFRPNPVPMSQYLWRYCPNISGDIGLIFGDFRVSFPETSVSSVSIFFIYEDYHTTSVKGVCIGS